MGAKLGTDGGPMSDINVTPLIDVVLVLLVVFMVVTPMIASDTPVELPRSTQSAKAKDVGVHVTITMTKDEGWFVEGDEVTIDSLIDVIQSKLNEHPERSLLLKADRNLTYGEVREALDLIAENRMTHVFVAVDKE
jgi:biopolymer transport protein TolR